jgi:hypothetical protein
MTALSSNEPVADRAARTPRLIGVYLAAAVGVLVCTAALKLLAALGESRALSHSDPVFTFLSIRQITFTAAVLELVVAAGVVGLEENAQRLWLLVWLSSMFLVYRIGLQWIHSAVTCPCLGGPAITFLSAKAQDVISKCLLAYLLAPSAVLIVRHSLKERHKRPTEGPGIAPGPARPLFGGGAPLNHAGFRLSLVAAFVASSTGWSVSHRYDGLLTVEHPLQRQSQALGISNNTTSMRACFRVESDGARWRIRIEPLERLVEGVGSDYQELFYDGHDLFTVDSYKSYTQPPTRAPQEEGPGFRPGSRPGRRGGRAARAGEADPQATNVFAMEAAATVQPSEVPQNVFLEMANPIWLTLLARGYLEKTHGELCGPVVVYGIPPAFLPTGHRVQITYDDRRPGDIRRIAIFYPSGAASEGPGPARPGLGPRYRYGKRCFDAPFDRGFTNAILEVGVYTNYSGLRVPSGSVLEILCPRLPGASSNDLAVVARYRLQVTNAQPTEGATVSIMGLPPQSLVTDARLTNFGPITYLSPSGGNWKTVGELQETEDYRHLAEIQRRALEMHRAARPRSTIVMLVLGIMLLIPPGVLLRGWLLRQRSVSEQKTETKT